MSVSPLPVPDTTRRSVASAGTYRDAERAVDWLSDQGFPVDGVSIVGTGLRYVERVSGRLTTGRAALVGAGQGAWIGLFFGLLFSLFFDLSTGGFFGLLLYGIVTGAVFGALWGAMFQWLRRGRRDFASVAQTRADHYEVQVDESTADEAQSLIARMPSAAARP
jgi:hypothetical protein